MTMFVVSFCRFSHEVALCGSSFQVLTTWLLKVFTRKLSLNLFMQFEGMNTGSSILSPCE